MEIAVDANTAYQMDAESGDAIITVDYENHPVKGKLTIYKKGEMLTGFKKDFIYEEKYLKGAEFNVYAAEDILHRIIRKTRVETDRSFMQKMHL